MDRAPCRCCRCALRSCATKPTPTSSWATQTERSRPSASRERASSIHPEGNPPTTSPSAGCISLRTSATLLSVRSAQGDDARVRASAARLRRRHARQAPRAATAGLPDPSGIRPRRAIHPGAVGRVTLRRGRGANLLLLGSKRRRCRRPRVAQSTAPYSRALSKQPGKD